MTKAFTAAMKEFFGLRPGQTIVQFGQELKELSFEEKMEFHGMLAGVGIDCAVPIPPKV